jgi:hypothetical protein
MAKVKDYITLIPVDDKMLEIKVKVLPRGTKNKSRWEEVCIWGKAYAEDNKLDSGRVDKIITQRRYGN